MEYKPPLYNSIYFNSALFSSKDDLLIMDDADKRYLRVSGGYTAYLSTSMLIFNGDNINLTMLANISPGVGSTSKALVLDSSGSITSGISALAITTANVNSLSLGGVAITSSASELNVLHGITATTNQLNYLSGASTGSALPSKALVVDYLKNIAGINSLSSTSLTGTLLTASQPNVTSLGPLIGLSTSSFTLNGTAITSTATEINRLSGLTATTSQLNYLSVTAGTATASKCLVLDFSSNITGINSLSSTSLSGTLLTASQPNITSLGTLTSLSLSGTLAIGGTALTSTVTELNVLHGISATTAQLNYLSGVTGGTALAAKALVLDSSSTITGINGLTLTSYSYISTVGKGQYVGNWFGTYWGIGPDTGNNDSTLRIGVCSNLTGTWSGAYGNLKLNNLTSTGNITVGAGIYVNSGQIMINSIIMSSTASELNYVNGVVQGTASAYRALVLDSSKNITGINSLTSTALSCTNMTYSGYIFSNNTNGAGRYIGDWNNSAYWGLGPDASPANNTIRIGVCSNVGVWSGYANLKVGSLYSSNAYIGSAGSGSYNLNILNTGADASFRIGASESLNNSFSMYFTYAGNGLSNNKLSFNSYGTGSILVLQADGKVGIGTGAPNHTLEIYNPSASFRLYDSSTFNDFKILSSTGYVTLYTHNNDSNLVLGTGSTGFLTISKYSSGQKVGIGGSPTTYPFEVNTSVNLSVPNYAFLNKNGNTGTSSTSGANYSCWFKDRINVTGEVNVTSDKRVKRNIEDLSLDRVIDFIKKIEPKSFIKRGEIKKSFGLMAQDVCKLGFDELVNLTPYDIEETEDNDGFISPRGYIFNLNYDGLTCINTKIIQYLLFKIEALESLMRDEF